MEDDHILADIQHGFHPRRSCESALLILLNKWYQLIDANNFVVVAALDFSKAFDTIQHKLLLQKLAAIGVEKAALKRFTLYLTSCHQCVRYADQLSSSLPVCSGVPQGSVFGPLLYLVYIYDSLQILPNSRLCRRFNDILFWQHPGRCHCQVELSIWEGRALVQIEWSHAKCEEVPTHNDLPATVPHWACLYNAAVTIRPNSESLRRVVVHWDSVITTRNFRHWQSHMVYAGQSSQNESS